MIAARCGCPHRVCCAHRVRCAHLTLVAALLALVLGCAGQRAHADDALDAAHQAQEQYDRGVSLRRTDPTGSQEAFRQSAAAWQQLADSGASNGPLFYNLGNAYLQMGDLGRAIANYLRAEQSMPGDPELDQNLAQARQRVQHAFSRSGGTLLVDSVARWWHLLPLGLREALAWTAWAVFWATLLAWFLVPARISGTPTRDAVRKLVLAVSLVTWCLLGGTLIADRVLSTVRPQGVLVQDAVQLRKGNGDGFEPAFAETLSPGVEFQILEERPGWWRIELPDGRSGWIQAAQAVRV